MTSSEAAKFGRITVDDTGIKKRPFLFFSKGFEVKWDEITGWAVTEMVIASAQSERVAQRILEIRTPKDLHHIQWSGSAANFNELIEHVRRHLPDKETRSVLEQISKYRNG